MRPILQTIVILLISAYPMELSAQSVAYDAPASATNTAAPATERDSSSMPLKPHAPTDREVGKPSGGLQTVITVGASLAVVLGVFFLVVWLMRRASPGGTGILPADVLEVLGFAPLANHQQVQLVRCGGKLLLVALGSSGTGASATTLTEITDPQEVEHLVGLCRQWRGGGSSKTFRQTHRQAGGHHA